MASDLEGPRFSDPLWFTLSVGQKHAPPHRGDRRIDNDGGLRRFKLLPQQHAPPLGGSSHRKNLKQGQVWQILSHRLSVHAREMSDDLARRIEHWNSDVAVPIEFFLQRPDVAYAGV